MSETQPIAKHKRKVNTSLLSLCFIFLCALVLVGYLFYTGDIVLLPQAFIWPQCGWLLVGLVLIIICWLWEAGVLYYIARSLIHRISYFTALRSTMVVQFFNNVTPFASGGQPMQIWSMWRDGIPVGDSTTIQLAKFAVYQVVLTLGSTLALLYDYPLFESHIHGWMALIIVSYIVQLCVLAFVITLIVKPAFMRWQIGLFKRIISHTPLKSRLAGLFDKAAGELDRFETSARKISGKPRVFFVAGLLTVIQLLFFFAIPFCACRALGIHPPLFATIAAAAFVLMVSGIVPLPGASGGAEGTFALVFSLFFPEGASVLVAVFIWRFLTFYVPIIAGSFFCFGAPKKKEFEQAELLALDEDA